MDEVALALDQVRLVMNSTKPKTFAALLELTRVTLGNCIYVASQATSHNTDHIQRIKVVTDKVFDVFNKVHLVK